MEYRINKSREGKYWSACPYWIGDTFQLDFIEQHAYNLMLKQGALVWTLDYLAVLFSVSLSTMRRLLDDMVDREIITKITFKNGSKRKCILIANYTEDGKRTREEIERIAKEGFSHLTAYQKKRKLEVSEYVNNTLLNEEYNDL